MDRLWTSSFRRICISNILMFISQYMLFPVIPVVMAERMELSVVQTGGTVVAFLLGMLLVAPFVNYLLDTYKRKNLCVFSLIIMLGMTVAYTIVRKPVELMIVPFIQGITYSIASSALLTLSIDIVTSANRTKGNIVFGWYTKLAMITGVALGGVLYLNFGLETMIVTSVAIGVLGILYLILVHVPFRAPIGMKLISLDRFFMPRSWVMGLNVLIVSFIPGVLLPLIYFKVSDVFLLDNWAVPYIFVVLAGFIIYLPLAKHFSGCENIKIKMLTGLTLLIISVSFLILFDTTIALTVSALLLGLGLAVTAIPFLLMFIQLASHCERSTANISHLIFWQTGLSLGMFFSCYLKENAVSGLLPFQVCIFCAALSLIFFILITYPYYSHKKVR